MNYTNRYNLKRSVKGIYNQLNKGARNKRTYAVTMLPGKNHQYSIPIKYLLKAKICNSLNMTVGQILRERRVTIRGTYVDKRTPVAFLDLLEVKNKEQTKSYIFKLKKVGKRIEPELSSFYKQVYPVVSFKPSKKGITVYTFQGKTFTMDLLWKDKLKKFGAYMIKLSDKLEVRSLLDFYPYFQVVKLSGKDMYQKYNIDSVEKTDQNYYKILLKNEGEKEKTVFLTKREFNQKYTFFLKEGVEIESQ